MTNFQFLTPEFKPLYEPARGAEQLVHSDPRAPLMRTRHALEQAVLWLCENDRTLRIPYDRSLNTLLNTNEFIREVPPPVLRKARPIQKFGNPPRCQRAIKRFDRTAMNLSGDDRFVYCE